LKGNKDVSFGDKDFSENKSVEQKEVEYEFYEDVVEFKVIATMEGACFK
jgi:hypothetical protein